MNPQRRMRRHPRRWPLLLVTPLLAALFTVVGATPATAATTTDGCVQSVPDPGTTAAVSICYTLFRPDGASATDPVPMILHGHGWGGSRTRDVAAFDDFLGAGFGVLSFDQRAFGESGGKAYLMNPDVEGQDVQRLIDVVAGLDWVARNKPGDPVLGAIGGSYGGGYQFVGAFTELRDRGATRFDALAPEITWHDLSESLAPQDVARTEWGLALYAAGLPSDAHTPVITQGVVESTATGTWPPAVAEFMAKTGPSWHVSQGRKLDIPVLLGQGITDNLFPLDQGLKNFQRALTRKAAKRSIFVGYNGGHALPSAVPLGTQVSGDPCSPALGSQNFRALALRFYTEKLLGERTGLGGNGRYHLATEGGRCQTVDTTASNTTVPLGSVISTVGAGAPISYPIARGPLTIAGTPTLDANVTSLSPDSRLFLALSVGSNALDTTIVQNNMLPLRVPGIVIDKPRKDIELPSVAVDVPAGQTLFLTVSPLSDMSFGHGSRVPGAMTLEDVIVHLPVVE